MAETKRQSTNNKVATPKNGAQITGDLSAALSKEVGARIKVTAAAPVGSLEGTVFAVDSGTGILALNTTPAPPNPSSSISSQTGDFHVIPISRIQSYITIAVSTESERVDTATLGYNLNALKAREDHAVAEAKKKAARRGKGVSVEGQKIFDWLSRTLPTRWDETSIIVNDAVRIVKPYRLDDCAAAKDKQNQLVRIKKELEAARKRIVEPQTATNKVAIPTPPRKGG